MKVINVVSRKPLVFYGEHDGKQFLYDGSWKRLEIVQSAPRGEVAEVPASLLSSIEDVLAEKFTSS